MWLVAQPQVDDGSKVGRSGQCLEACISQFQFREGQTSQTVQPGRLGKGSATAIPNGVGAETQDSETGQVGAGSDGLDSPQAQVPCDGEIQE